MMSPQLFFVIFALAPLASGHLGGLTSSDQAPRVYCGRALSQMIDSLCYAATSSNTEKRSEGGMYGMIIPPYYKEQDNHVGWPWLSHKSALGSFRGKRFISGGVADECCDKPCSITELLQYC